jgi:hypothetical protein
MFDDAFKIELIKYLESVTLGSTESTSLEVMTTRQLDDLIRLCRVNPDDLNSMARAKVAMERHTAFREELRRKYWGKDRTAELNQIYRGLAPECKLAFHLFVEENLDLISEHVADDADFAWLKDDAQSPSIDFWTKGVGEVMNEIMCRISNTQTVDGALTCQFKNYDGSVRQAICCDTLVQVLDPPKKNDLFWTYARTRLGR